MLTRATPERGNEDGEFHGGRIPFYENGRIVSF